MSESYNGGPAFPVNSELLGQYSGMNLRDWFAGQYLAGLCSTPFFTNGNLTNDKLAVYAYAMADAMLKARSAR